MTIVTILRQLWHQRLTVSLVALVSVMVGMAVGYKVTFPPSIDSRQYQIGIATARILLDTPSSQIVEIAPKGSETLGERANLLSNLMIDGELKSAIAKRAGLAPDALLVVASDAIEPATAKPSDLRRRDARILTTKVLTNDAGVQLPIIDVEAQAPSVSGAATLANAAVVGLREFLDSKAAAEKVPDARRLRVSGLGAARTGQVSRGPSHILAIAVAIVLFGTLCGLLVAFAAFARSWREVALAEEAVSADPDESGDASDHVGRPLPLRDAPSQPSHGVPDGPERAIAPEAATEPHLPWSESHELPPHAPSSAAPWIPPPHPVWLDPRSR
jgi:hypothetical protein